jgi:sec-independent protein translocase protein TatA
MYAFPNHLLLSMPGGSEWILIILVVLLLFGGRNIPELMRGMGRGIREFNDAKNNVKNELEEGMREMDTTAVRVKEAKLA